MKILVTLLTVGVVGVLVDADIDINRIKQISNRVPINKQSISDRLTSRSNDYDDHSSWYQQPRSPISLSGLEETSDPKAAVQVHEPREDPRLYYQSDAYIKEHVENMNEEVTFVYPGRHVVRAGQAGLSRIRSNENNFSTARDVNICVKCPHDLTLVAKASSGRVALQTPSLRACSGRRAPRSVQFVHMYGPQFGSLLEQGAHVVIGRIMFKNKDLQLCKIQVHVVTQGCQTPRHLEAHCWDHNKQCNFTCVNKKLELIGPKALVCEDNKWKGDLPICKVRTWCEYPQIPERGRVSCLGTFAGTGTEGVAEGARCRVRCARGFRSRGSPVCRQGTWTQTLSCQPIRKRYISKPKQ